MSRARLSRVSACVSTSVSAFLRRLRLCGIPLSAYSLCAFRFVCVFALRWALLLSVRMCAPVSVYLHLRISVSFVFVRVPAKSSRVSRVPVCVCARPGVQASASSCLCLRPVRSARAACVQYLVLRVPYLCLCVRRCLRMSAWSALRVICVSAYLSLCSLVFVRVCKGPCVTIAPRTIIEAPH